MDSVGVDQIMVTYTGVVMKNSNGTINLFAPTTGCCLIGTQHCLRLATATMDAGTLIAVTLDSVE